MIPARSQSGFPGDEARFLHVAGFHDGQQMRGQRGRSRRVVVCGVGDPQPTAKIQGADVGQSVGAVFVPD